MPKRGKHPPSKVLKTIPATDVSAVHDALKAPHRPVLVVISGKQAGFRKVVEQAVLIGRDPAVDLVLTDALASGQHARVEDRGDGWALVDLGSTNGTSVNGRKGTEFVLAPGDKIVVGRTVLRFEVQSPLDRAYDDLVQKLLSVDDLSGLLTRRKFDEDLKIAVEAARARGDVLGLLVMDMDGIKQVNDTHGHLFGAYTIGECGHIVGNVIAQRGFASRFGGDEFIAALPGCDLEASERIAEQIRQAVADHRFEREGVVLKPGISIGVAAFPQSATDAGSLFQRADEALYRAKRGGKNRVCR